MGEIEKIVSGVSARSSNNATRRENIVLTIITVDRSSSGRENYLNETVTNLVRSNARFRHKQLFPSRVADAHWQHVWKYGYYRDVSPADRDYLPCENAGRALVGGAEIASRLGVEWVLFCEDDLDFCAEFSSSVAVWLDEHASDDYRVYSFGCAYPNVELLSRPGASMIVNGNTIANPTYWRYPCAKFYGTQCFAIRRDDARSLGAYLLTNPDIRGVKSPGAYDLMIHDWMAREYPNDHFFLASVPSFVQHIGRQSVCTGLAVTHTFPSWKGREWKYCGRDVNVSVSAESVTEAVVSANTTNVTKRAFIVLGAESSGTRMLTSILIAGGCHGSIEHVQPIDDPEYDILPYRDVVWRRSVPHDGELLNLFSLVNRINKQGVREITVLSIRRNLDCNAKSQVWWGHASDYESACKRIKAAETAIFLAKLNSKRVVEWLNVSYESFVNNPTGSQVELWPLLSLPGGEPIEIHDGNAKYRDCDNEVSE